MKIITLLLLCLGLLTYVQVFSQIGVDNTSPDPSSVLDLTSSDKGLLIPRMTSAQRTAIASPASSLLVFDTTVNLYFYYFNGSWQPLNPWLPSSSNIYYNSGNVGVGTTSPRGKLDIDGPGDIYLSDDPFVGTAQTLFIPGHIFMSPYSGSNVSYFQARRPDDSGTTSLRFRTSNSGSINESMHIEGNGNIGIGTISPQEKLHIEGAVRGNQSGALRISSGYGYVDVGPRNTTFSHFMTDRAYYYFNKPLFVDGSINSYSPNLVLATNGTERLTVLGASGNVGVGTASPAYKLDVNGTLNATAIYVNGSPLSVSGTIPSGGIIMWSGAIGSIPSGWALCDGSSGTPDLRNRFIVGAGSTYGVGNTGGNVSIALLSNQIPHHTHAGTTTSDGSHTHIINGETMQKAGTTTVQNKVLDTGTDTDFGAYTESTASAGSHSHSISSITSTNGITGAGQQVDIRPPYYALAYIMKLP